MTLEPGDHVRYWNGQVSQELGIPQAAWFRGFQGPTDYLGHGKEIFNFVIYESEIVRDQPHMRNFPAPTLAQQLRVAWARDLIDCRA